MCLSSDGTEGNSWYSPFPRHEHSDCSIIVVADRQIDIWKMFYGIYAHVGAGSTRVLLARFQRVTSACDFMLVNRPRYFSTFALLIFSARLDAVRF